MSKDPILKIPRLLLVVFLSLLTIISCKKDDLSDPCAEEDIGRFRLLDNAINSIPYKENTTLFFQDSIGNQVEFEFIYGNGGYVSGDIIHSSACVFDTSLQKVYKANEDYYRYDVIETNDSLNIKLIIVLKVKPFFLHFGTIEISDQLGIGRSLTGSNSSAIHLNILVNSRELTEEDINMFLKPIDNINLHGRTFYNVYYNTYSSFYYNYEKGIIAFTDLDEKLWVLDKTEKKK